MHDIFGNHFGIFFLCLDATNEYELREAFTQQLIARLGGDKFVVAFFDARIPAELAQQVEAFIDHSSAIFHSTQTVESLALRACIAYNNSSQGVAALLSCADKDGDNPPQANHRTNLLQFVRWLASFRKHPDQKDLSGLFFFDYFQASRPILCSVHVRKGLAPAA